MERGDGTTSSRRLLSADLLSGMPSLPPAAPGEESETLTTALTEFKGVQIGVWDIAPGVATDTEVDEVFLVLAGKGRVAFEDGSSLELRPGVLVGLVAGDRTTWSIDEPLRKVYFA